MLLLKKCITISIITLKSYYLNTSKGVSLLMLPFVMVFVFILQSDSREQSDNLRLIVNSLVLATCFSNINVLSSSIAYDKSFLRIKLYKSSNISFRLYVVGVALPSIVSTLFAHLLLIFTSPLFFCVNLSNLSIMSFIFISIFSSLSLMCIGVYVGLFTKDLVAAHTIANLVSSILTFFSGVFFSIKKLNLVVLAVFLKVTPLTYISNSFYSQLLPSFLNSTSPYLSYDVFVLFLIGLSSVIITLCFDLWRK